MFKFRLQRVLDMRAKTEEDAGIQLATARESAERARELAVSLEAARAESIRRGASGGSTVGELQNLTYLIGQLDLRIDAAYQAVGAADAEVQSAFDRFTEAVKERRMLDKLRERDLTHWRANETQLDRNTMDAIALTRFTRPAIGSVEETVS